MPYRPVEPALRKTVEALVDAAVASGKLSAVDIVAQFIDSGVNQSTLFRWIDRRATELTSGIPIGRNGKPMPPPREPIQRQALAVVPREPDGVPVMQIIQSNLEVLQRGLAMAMDEEGKIKNPRLMLACVSEIGKHITHTARAQMAMSLEIGRRQDQFLDELLDIVMEAIPEKRSEVLSKMDALGLRYRSVA